MSTVEFKGFAGVRLEADVTGSTDDPAVLLVHGGGQSRSVWKGVAAALVQAGRQVFNLDLRGHGNSEWPASGHYEFDAYVEDLRSVMAQLGTRPVVVGASMGGWVAAAALGVDAAHLAAGLVLVDLPTQFDADALLSIADKLRHEATQSALKPEWDVRVMGAIDVASIPARLSQAAPKITVPVLFVRGALSELGTTSDAAKFVRLLPDAELAEVENARQLVKTDRIETFNALLLDFLERRLPRAPSEFRAGSDIRTLRDAMGCFVTGVTVVTAMTAEGNPVGLTASSFTSVSLEPPLLLVCIASNAGSANTLRAASFFAVNVLQIGQQPTSNRFALKGENRFEKTPWRPGETGAPVLSGALSAFECQRQAVHEAGDHFILVGHVVRASFDPRRDPLLYFRGKYRRLHFV